MDIVRPGQLVRFVPNPEVHIARETAAIWHIQGEHFPSLISQVSSPKSHHEISAPQQTINLPQYGSRQMQSNRCSIMGWGVASENTAMRTTGTVFQPEMGGLT